MSEDDYYGQREERLIRNWRLNTGIDRDRGRQPEDYQSWRAANISWETRARPSWRFNHIGGFFEVFIDGQTVKIDAWVRRGGSRRFARTGELKPVGRVAEAHFGAADNGRIRNAVRRAISYAEAWIKKTHRRPKWWIDCDLSLIDGLDFEEWLTTRPS